MAISAGDAVWTIKGDITELKNALAHGVAQVKSRSAEAAQAARTMGAGMTVVGAGIVTALGAAVKGAASFESAITNAASVTGKTGTEFDTAKAKMEDLAMTLGQTTVFSASEAANAFYDLSSKGFDVAAMSVEQLKPMLDLAAATQSDLTSTTEILTGTLRGFNMTNDETTRIADVMTKAIGSSAANMEKFGVSMPIVATAAKQVGVTFEETSAALGLLYNKGIDASTAATGLRNVMLDISAMPEPIQKKLEALGVSFEGLDLRTDGLVGTLEKLKERGLSAEEALAVFGKRSGVVAAAMIDGTAKIDGLTEALENAAGAAQETADKQLDTLEGQLKLLKSAIESVALPIGKAFIPAMTKAASVMGKVFQWLGKLVKEHKILGGAVAWAGGTIGAFLITAGPLLYFLPKAIEGVKALTFVYYALTPALHSAATGFWHLTAAAGPWLLLTAAIVMSVGFAIKKIKELHDYQQETRELELQAVEREVALKRRVLDAHYKNKFEMRVASNAKALEEIQAAGIKELQETGKVSEAILAEEARRIKALRFLRDKHNQEIPEITAKVQQAVLEIQKKGHSAILEEEVSASKKMLDQMAADATTQLGIAKKTLDDRIAIDEKRLAELQMRALKEVEITGRKNKQLDAEIGKLTKRIAQDLARRSDIEERYETRLKKSVAAELKIRQKRLDGIIAKEEEELKRLDSTTDIAERIRVGALDKETEHYENTIKSLSKHYKERKTLDSAVIELSERKTDAEIAAQQAALEAQKEFDTEDKAALAAMVLRTRAQLEKAISEFNKWAKKVPFAMDRVAEVFRGFNTDYKGLCKELTGATLEASTLFVAAWDTMASAAETRMGEIVTAMKTGLEDVKAELDDAVTNSWFIDAANKYISTIGRMATATREMQSNIGNAGLALAGQHVETATSSVPAPAAPAIGGGGAVINIATLVVREEADVHKMAGGLAFMLQSRGIA